MEINIITTLLLNKLYLYNKDKSEHVKYDPGVTIVTRLFSNTGNKLLKLEALCT